MAAFSTLIAALLTFIVTSNAGKYGECSYIIEPNNGVYNSVLDPKWQDLSIPTRAYSAIGNPDECNYFNDYSYNNNEGRSISWTYSCDMDKDEVEVKLYQGSQTCSGYVMTYTYTRDNNPNDEWFCGYEGCALSIERWHNEGNDTCDSTFLLNKYSIVNGQCEYASDLSENSGGYDYWLSASCWDTDAYSYGIWSDETCDYGPDNTVTVGDGTCPSDQWKEGSLRYIVDTCSGEPFTPSTTMPDTTEMYDDTCAYVHWSFIPFPFVIGEDYNVVFPELFEGNPTCGYFSCQSGSVMFTAFDNAEGTCSGDMVASQPASNFFGPPYDYNCAGSGDYCDVAWVSYLDIYDEAVIEDITWDTCIDMVKETGIARFPVPMDLCYEGMAGGQEVTCSGDFEFTVDIYNYTNCSYFSYRDSSLYEGIGIINNATQFSCVYAWKEGADGEPEDICPMPEEKSCTYASLQGPPWAMGQENCQYIGFGGFPMSGYLWCDDRMNVRWTAFFNNSDCSGNATLPNVDAADFFDGIGSYNCYGSSDLCDVVKLSFYEMETNDTERWPLINESTCLQRAMDEPLGIFSVPLDICMDGGRTLTCDGLELTVDFYRDNDTYCENTPYMSDFERGFDINNTDTEIICVLPWRADNEPVCETDAPTPQPTTACDECGDCPETATCDICEDDDCADFEEYSNGDTWSTHDHDHDEDEEEKITCTMVRTDSSDCEAECVEQWWRGNVTVNCDDDVGESGCVAFMVKMAFATIIGSWLWI